MYDNCSIIKSDIGNYYEFLENYKFKCYYKDSYLAGQWADFEQWKTLAKAKIFELLNYYPQEAPLNAKTLNIIDKGYCIQEEIEFNTARNIRVRGSLLLPVVEGKHPAVIALHDHGGFYYYGREKIVSQQNETQILKNFKDLHYGGRSWADEIVKRGYVVLCIDAFYFGTRKLNIEQVSDVVLETIPYKFNGIMQNTDEYIDVFNKFCFAFEALLVKHFFISGITWPGILFHDDRKCIDYLCTRKEVDKDRIGCCGLSIGGFRAAHLAALDQRIRCSVVAGWMPTYDSLLFNRLRYHTYMIYIPNLTYFFDISDVISLTAPNPLLVQQCSRDGLYNMQGMQKACLKIREVYKKIGCPERYRYEFYDNGHEFNVNMQEEAFNWLDSWLK